jgi:hypothetical protein
LTRSYDDEYVQDEGANLLWARVHSNHNLCFFE